MKKTPIQYQINTSYKKEGQSYHDVPSNVKNNHCSKTVSTLTLIMLAKH